MGQRADRRRAVLGGLGLLAGIGLAGRDASAAKKPEQLPPQIGDRLMIIKGALKDQLLRPELLEIGAAQVEGFPFDPANDLLRKRNRLNRLLFVRTDEAGIEAEFAPLSAAGVLAFSAICTHKGCTINSWLAEERHLRCHCHLSEFDILAGGAIRGGPARAPLPMLGLALDAEGYVVVAEEFNRKPGFKG